VASGKIDVPELERLIEKYPEVIGPDDSRFKSGATLDLKIRTPPRTSPWERRHTLPGRSLVRCGSDGRQHHHRFSHATRSTLVDSSRGGVVVRSNRDVHRGGEALDKLNGLTFAHTVRLVGMEQVDVALHVVRLVFADHRGRKFDDRQVVRSWRGAR
jgi:hypothetical protein